MPSNQTRKQLLERIKTSTFPGSIIDVFKAADQGVDLISQYEQQQQQQQQQQGMQVANTPEQQEVGLREQHAMGNTDASMAFPNVEPNQSFNTMGMKAPINIEKVNDQGHLVESYKNVPPGIQDLPTGPYEGTIIESPAAYQTGGIKDTVIYPPGDSQYRFEPFNKEILDIRPKLQRKGLYNIENKDLQKAWEWEKKEKQKIKNRNKTNRDRIVRSGGVRKYQNAGEMQVGPKNEDATGPLDKLPSNLDFNLDFECLTGKGKSCEDKAGTPFQIGPTAGLSLNRGLNYSTYDSDGNFVSSPNVSANFGGRMRYDLGMNDRNWNPVALSLGYNRNQNLIKDGNTGTGGTNNIFAKLGRYQEHRPPTNDWSSGDAKYNYGLTANYDLTNNKLNRIGVYGQHGIISGSASINPSTGKPYFSLGLQRSFKKGGLKN